MLLVESGQVKLDDPIGRYLDNLPPSWREVSIRRLLNHTSGLPDIINKASEALADTAGDAINLVRDKPVESAPGSRWSYNQTNYMLLQMPLEKVSGRRFELIVLTNLIGADPPSMVTEIARRYLADSP